MSHAVFDIVTNDPEIQHVTGDVEDAAVQEHLG